MSKGGDVCWVTKQHAQNIWEARQHFVYPEPNSGCYLWAGACKKKGYGHISIQRNGVGCGKTTVTAHRIAYIAVYGEIPNDMTIDHLCGVSCCVNTDHMELVSRSENTRRAKPGEHNRRKVCCPNGHLYDKVDIRGSRVCSICRRVKRRRHV